jgi:archaellum biogenesis ATPase FlaH
VDYEDIESHRVEGGQYCIADELLDNGLVAESKMERCGSSDAMSTYENTLPDGTVFYTSYCYSCSQKFNKKAFSNSSWAVEFGVEPSSGKIIEKKEFKRKPKAKRINKEEAKEVIGYGTKGRNYRGLKDKYLEFFGHRVKLGYDGRPKVVFYPETQDDGKLFGYKSRTLPKHFGYENKGITGMKSELSGQFKFKDMHFRDILIVGGEEDKVAGFQMFDEYLERRYGDSEQEFTTMPVVSPTTGESSALKQIKANYDFVNRADNIYLGLDNDEVGRAAMEEIAAIFPKEKIKFVYWTYKDPNNFINNDEKKDYSAQFIRDFFSAKPYVPTKTKSSMDIYKDVAEELLKPRITLPFYMSKLSRMMGGNTGEEGLLQGRIVNVIGDTSVGKSTHVNAMAYHWCMHSPQKPVIASLEATAGQYTLDIMSIHLGENVRKGRTGKEVLAYLDSPEVQERLADLWVNEYGEERFRVIDEREGSIRDMEIELELAYHRDGCELFVIDVLTDLLRSMPNEKQSEHMTWQKNMVKKGVTIVNVLHTKKPTRGKDGKLNRISEYDALGSTTFVQSAAVNILIDRDKMIEDAIEKNTTRVRMPKCREGDTGVAGEWYYDHDTRQVHDRNYFFKELHPEKLPSGYDLSFDPYGDNEEEQKTFSKKAGSKKSAKEEVEDDLYDDVPL